MNSPFVAEPRSRYQSLPPIVVDCSVIAAVLFNEANRDAAAESVAGKSLFAPWLIDHKLVSVALKKANEVGADVARAGLEDALG